MKNFGLPKSVKRITLIDPAHGDAVEVYRAETKRKKQSKGLRFFERGMRRGARMASTFVGTYLERHERSNRKRRDGWVGDYATNVAKAQRAAMKRAKFGRMLAF